MFFYADYLRAYLSVFFVVNFPFFATFLYSMSIKQTRCVLRWEKGGLIHLTPHKFHVVSIVIFLFFFFFFRFCIIKLLRKPSCLIVLKISHRLKSECEKNFRNCDYSNVVILCKPYHSSSRGFIKNWRRILTRKSILICSNEFVVFSDDLLIFLFEKYYKP